MSEVNRQYIGARYVPKFFENPSTTDSAWLEGVAYEALTIVTYAGNSYTSKKPVPAGIGSPNSAPEYWVATGIFNQQLEAVRQQGAQNAEDISALSDEVTEVSGSVEDLNDKMSEMATAPRQFILIGDSYGGGVDGDNNTQTVTGGGWIQRFREAVAGWATVYNSQTPLGGVYGFASSRPFLDVLRDAEQSIPDKSKITDIVVLGGTNDVGIDAATIIARIRDFITYARTNYPQARLAIGCLGAHVYDMVQMGENAYSKCSDYGAEYIADLRGLYGLSQYIGADGTHLKAAGYAFYTPFINQAILTGRSVWKFTGQGDFTLSSASMTAVSDLKFEYIITNDSFTAELISNPIGEYRGEAIISINAGTGPAFYPIGSQNVLQSIPLPYSKTQSFICEGHVFEAYIDPSNVLSLIITTGLPSGGQARSGASMAKMYMY